MSRSSKTKGQVRSLVPDTGGANDLVQHGYRTGRCAARSIDVARMYAVSSTLDDVDWNAELVRPDDLEGTVRRMKDEPGEGLRVCAARRGNLIVSPTIWASMNPPGVSGDSIF